MQWFPRCCAPTVVATPERLAHVRTGASVRRPPSWCSPRHLLTCGADAVTAQYFLRTSLPVCLGAQRWPVSVTCSKGAASQGRPCLTGPKPIGRRSNWGRKVAHDLSCRCHKQFSPPCLPATGSNSGWSLGEFEEATKREKNFLLGPKQHVVRDSDRLRVR